jgi:hypothetical protein
MNQQVGNSAQVTINVASAEAVSIAQSTTAPASLGLLGGGGSGSTGSQGRLAAR